MTDQNRLSILAVGTESGSPVSLSGGGFIKDKNGAIVIPKLNSQPLKKLADEKQGLFTELSIDDWDVERIISAETAFTGFIKKDGTILLMPLSKKWEHQKILRQNFKLEQELVIQNHL